jgi:hypothetical protein
MRGGTECLVPGPLGYIGIMGTHITEQCIVLGNFYYKQQLNSGRCGFLVGRFDPNDFMDVLGYANRGPHSTMWPFFSTPLSPYRIGVEVQVRVAG